MTDKNKFKPKLRIDAKYDLQAVFSELVHKIISQTDPIYQSCISCDHFTEATENCSVWNTRPPARVICFGCDKWINEDEIPF